MKSSQNFPLLVVVDELDRCRPPFAVELLEKIKHLFSVENVNFVLVTNKRQLKNSIKTVYGGDIDADLYLQSFLTLSKMLPKKEIEEGSPENFYMSFCEQVVEDHEMSANQHWSGKDLADLLSYYAAHFNLSLRQIEKSARLLTLHFAQKRCSYMQLAVFIAVLAAIDSETTGKIARKQLGLADLKQQFNIAAFFENRLKYEPKGISRLKHLSLIITIGFGSPQEFEEIDAVFKEEYLRQFFDFNERGMAAGMAERMMSYQV